MAHKDSLGWSKRFWFSLLLFGICREWFLPLVQLSDYTKLHITAPFLAAFAVFLLIDTLHMADGWKWLIKLSVCAGIIGYLFFPDSFPGFGWVLAFISILGEDGKHLIDQEYVLVGREFRTLLFLGGWMMLLSATQSIILQRHRAWWVMLGTIIYLLGLQLALGVDTNAGLVRAVGLCLALVALCQLSLMERRFDLSRRRGAWSRPGITVSLLVVIGAWASGYVLANHHSSEMKPLQFPGMDSYASWFEGLPVYQDWMEQSPLSTSTIGKTGYSSSDFRLGGAVQPDDSLAFIAFTEKMTYWRGESKSYYDGKGWTQVEKQWSIEQLNEPMPAAKYASSNASEMEQHLFIQNISLGRPFFAGGTIREIADLTTSDGKAVAEGSIYYYPSSDKYLYEQSLPIASYHVKVDVPYIQWSNQLPATESLAFAVDSLSSDNARLQFADYVQLPDELPIRVTDLAKQITAGTKTDVERALAIEAYLKNNYVYSLDQSVHPPVDQDFVDHFLFEQKLGYCNHFSSAMVILLRTLGIPSRWVKGFAPGEQASLELLKRIPAIENYLDLHPEMLAANDTPIMPVAVRNANAHSWVEAYFPHLGWISFEPTPGFSGTIEQSGDNGLEEAFLLQQQSSIETSSMADSTISTENAEQDHEQSSTGEGNQWFRNGQGVGFIAAVAVCILFIIGVSWTWKSRFAIVTWLLLCKYPINGSLSKYELPLLDGMWSHIFRQLGDKSKSITLREYVYRMQPMSEERQRAWRQFLLWYEHTRYSSDFRVAVSKEQLLAVWRIIGKLG